MSGLETSQKTLIICQIHHSGHFQHAFQKRQLTSYYVQGRDGGEDSAEPKPVHLQDVEEEFSTSLHSLGINMVMVINKETFANH